MKSRRTPRPISRWPRTSRPRRLETKSYTARAKTKTLTRLGAAAQKCARSAVGGRPRGHDIVDKYHGAAFDSRRHPFRHPKRALQIESPLRGSGYGGVIVDRI